MISDGDYQLNLSRLAFNFKGAVGMEYLQCADTARIRELIRHVKAISGELKADG